MQGNQKKRLEELLLEEMEKLNQLTSNYIEKDESIAKMEMGYLRQLLSIGLVLLKFVIRIKIDQKRGELPMMLQGENIKRRGNGWRKYLSLFGLLEFKRPFCKSDQRGMIYLLDEQLEFPRELWSYNLQELVAESSSEVDFTQSVSCINKLLDLGLHGAGSKRNKDNLGQATDAYYAEKEVQVQSEAVCFCASFDGKGVPMIKPVDKTKGRELKRLGKGEKRGIKQMATVGVMSYFEPKERTVAGIIKGLMEYPVSKKEEKKQEVSQSSSKPLNDNRWHQEIHRRAFLADQDKCIDYGIRYIKERMGNSKSKFIVPIDAGKGLEDKVLRYVKLYGLENQFAGIILDIIHVSEYVWDCANAILGESSKLRPEWVRQMLEDLLNSKTKKVIEDLEKIIEKGNLTKTKKQKIQKTVTYFSNHQHKMDYKSFLEKGYSISSALVESNCGHLVKDRMEQSGMRWSKTGAQNMMDLRAIKLNGDLEDFIAFKQRKNSKLVQTAA